MDLPPATSADRPGPANGRRFSWIKLGIWLPAAIVVGVLVAWAAEVAQTYFAPLVLFPILVGLGLGAVLIALMRLAQVAQRPTILLGTLLAAAVTVVGQHYLGYRVAQEHVKRFDEIRRAFPEVPADRFPDSAPGFGQYLRAQAEQGRPIFGQYVARGWLAWLSWLVDGLLVLAGALAVMVPAMRLPYCDRCASWYRTIRGSRLDVPRARRLAQAAHIPPLERPLQSARYRLSSCRSGCGPLRLELAWETTDGETHLLRTWLDAESRRQVTAVLEEIAGGGKGVSP